MERTNCGSIPAEWPYPVKYGAEHRIETDVLIIGAGIAGATAGIMAARRGVKVAVVDKSPIDISGCGGAGVDHYLNCVSNPGCTLTPEEYMEIPPDGSFDGGKISGRDHRTYIQIKGSWDNLMELEKLGLHFRDEEDEFAGAPFRDDATKIMYAYDYKNKLNIRLRGGAFLKKHLRDGLVNEKTAVLYERVMITCLLTEDGKQGGRIAGAMGVHEETGELYIFNTKCAIISTAGVSMQGTSTWVYNLEMFGNGYRNDPRCTGDGVAMAWNAGAEVHSEELFGQNLYTGPFGWPWYGIGNPDNTWSPCTIVDNNGKEIPWVDSYGKPISTIVQRSLPAEGQPFIGTKRPSLTPDLPELIEKGVYELPLWADLTSLPEDERRVIWGLMVGNEGRTRTAIYEYYNKAGFNPEKDMLWCPVMIPENYRNSRKDWFQGDPGAVRQWKADTLKGVATDWNQMSSIEGLFACGSESGQGGACAGSSGAYTGNRAAEYAMRVAQGCVSETQITAEKERIYAPVKRANTADARISWKELWMGMARVMQQDCGDYRSKTLCEHGLMWLDSIKRHEMKLTYARNPHELVRVLECESRITVAEIYLYLGIANFRAIEAGISEEQCMFTKLFDGKTVTTYKDDKWWLKAPYAPTYSENYKKCRASEKEVI